MQSSYVLAAGFLVHLIFLASMFDIYFRTPIVQGILSNPNTVPAPAKRLVFIVADGLRADSFFSNEKKSTPFLRNKIENYASWGVSQTRVPTESRPGVVALAAGIYEDPSAVFKGWKENPVEFDSIFNQSHHTWAWGSPDIVHMFKQDHVETMSYHSDDEDFSGKDSSWKLDEWVFDHVKVFFDKARLDPKVSNLLHQDKIVFFLHLLGLDTAGHTIKPNSKKYQENLRVVDRGVRDIENLIENFFGDGKTSYVFTADHGMTNWGSHGAGSKDETEVPLLAWGAGIKLPKPSHPRDSISPDEWQLGHLERKDVKQADIVVLLASLIGCNIPVNSMGRLPLSYLDLPSEHVAQLSLLNSRQLLAQAERKRELVSTGTLSMLFIPYHKLLPEIADSMVKLNLQHLKNKNYEEAVTLSGKLSDLSVGALHYYHNYHQIPLLISISLSFLGWIALLFCQLNNFTINTSASHVNVIFFALGLIIFLFIQVQQLDWQFYLYCLLPVLLWWGVFTMMDSWSQVLGSGRKISKFLLASALMLLFTEIMVAAFFQRWVLSVGMLIVSLWPLSKTEKIKLLSPSMLFLWLFSCASVAFFPLLPVIGSESNLFLVVSAGILWSIAIAASVFALYGTLNKKEIVIELSPLLASTAIVYCVAKSMEHGDGLPPHFQFLSWGLLGAPFLLFTVKDTTIPRRLIKLHATILSPYMLMSVRHEGLFLLALCLHLNCWLVLEGKMNGIDIPQLKRIKFPHPRETEKAKRQLTIEDIRRAALFVFYTFLSFFGTGNIASLNSFEVIWVRCFISVFSPFTMMILILVKMLIPFVIVNSIFRGINICLKAPTAYLFTVVLIICDLMGVHFLHLVRNEGSWLDIGTSISHYVIVQVTVLALVFLYGVASILTGVYLSRSPLKILTSIFSNETEDAVHKQVLQRRQV